MVHKGQDSDLKSGHLISSTVSAPLLHASFWHSTSLGPVLSFVLSVITGSIKSSMDNT
jgi:hypothetical protein